VKVLEVFEADEAAKSLAAFLDPLVGIECVERVPVQVGKPDAVILDLKAADFRETAVKLGLPASLCTDRDFSIRLASFVNSLDGVYDHLDDRCVDRSIGTDVLNRSSNVDVAHRETIPLFFSCGACEYRIPHCSALRYGL